MNISAPRNGVAGSRTGNALLDQLPDEDWNQISLLCEEVSPDIGAEIYRSEGPIHYVYFPLSGMYSVVVDTKDGKTAETATVGPEGMVGVPAVLGLNFSPERAVIQVRGHALRVPAPSFLRVMRLSSFFQDLMQRYAAYTLRYANQTIACNLLHPIAERMCRWLLMAQDRAMRGEFELTHEFLAEMLGVRRQSVTLVAGTLQSAGLISYRRGVIRVLDRQGLENSSCECYEVTTRLYRRIMG